MKRLFALWLRKKGWFGQTVEKFSEYDYWSLKDTDNGRTKCLRFRTNGSWFFQGIWKSLLGDMDIFLLDLDLLAFQWIWVDVSKDLDISFLLIQRCNKKNRQLN